eukprot:3403685-Pyramimonas_sp.AAC.1
MIELADNEREDEHLRNWNAFGEDDKPKLDKERSLGYVRRAKRRQYAGDEQTFRTLIRIKQSLNNVQPEHFLLDE